MPAKCGDGKVQAPEQCDDSNQVDNDACTNKCKLPVCGDSIVQPAKGEGCDDGNVNSFDACVACQLAACGDGALWIGNEFCDDGGENFPYNNCDETCTGYTGPHCGNEFVQKGYGEECDGEVDNGICSNDCKIACDFGDPICDQWSCCCPSQFSLVPLINCPV